MKNALALLAATLVPCSTAAPQTAIHSWPGVEGGNQAGFDVGAVGDLDQDGYPDVIVGEPYFKDFVGLVQVRSGRDGSVLFRHKGISSPFAGVGLQGWAVEGGRDVDGDGVPDYIVGGAPYTYYNFGTATVYSGATGEIVHREKGLGLGFSPGAQVLLLDDLDGDGRAEYASAETYGDLYVWDGLSAAVVYVTSRSGGVWSHSLANVGDLSGDGRGDILVGAPNSAPNVGIGWVDVLDSQDGSVLFRVDGFELGDRFGWATAGAGDFDADGKPELLIGAPDAVGGEGRAYLLSGADGAVLMTLSGGADDDEFGAAVAAGGDFDGDGVGDLAVGAPENDDFEADAGKVTVFSGVDGTVLGTFLGGTQNGRLGFSVAWAGDVDLGGRDDLLVGAPFTKFGTGPSGAKTGLATLYRAEPEAGVFCSAKLNSQSCLPRISASGTPSLGASDFRVAANQLINQQAGFLFWGTGGPLAGPFMGGTKCVASPVKRIPVLTGGNVGPDDCTGTIDVPWDSAYLAAQGFSPGQTVHAQLWHPDPSASHGVGLSDALRFDVLP